MKKQLRQLKLAFLVVACLIPLSASANPTDLKLSFTYTSRGKLAVDVKFDQPATTRCIARHRVSLYHEDDVQATLRKSAFNRIVTPGRKSTSLRAQRLLGAQKKNGKDPILAVQTRLICGSEQIDSNVEARYIICGDSTVRLSLKKYFKRLKQALE